MSHKSKCKIKSIKNIWRKLEQIPRSFYVAGSQVLIWAVLKKFVSLKINHNCSSVWPSTCISEDLSLTIKNRRADPSPYFVCYVVSRVRERCSLPHPLPPMAGKRAGLGITRGRELALPLNSCSTWESRPCTLSGQHTRANSVVGSTDVHALRA